MGVLFSGVCPASRRFGKLCIVLIAVLCPSLALAAPQGGRVTHGSATINQKGNTTNINQSSNKASINWNRFSVNPRETVNFNQPGRNSVTLNRVVGNEKSVIQGALNANGKVFLINSNGVMFTRGATVNTAGFVASTLDISDTDFENGKYRFQGSGKSSGEIINMGTIRVTDGGYAALLGEKVSNQGIIVADKGTVVLAGGKRVTLNFNGDSLVNVSLDEGALNALVENKQAIQADGGKVILTAKAAGDLLSAQVNTSGIVRARSMADLKGEILVDAKGGTARIDGVLDASAPVSGNGGFIETSGDKVLVADSAVITAKSKNGKAGTWLIDPVDFTVGKDGDISGTALSENLGNQNVIIESTRGKNKNGKGDIHVNEKVAWKADTKLTLTAENDININASITATGERAGLAMNYGGDYNILTKASYSGAVLDENGKPVANKAPEGTEYASITLSGRDASLNINGNEYVLIHSMADFDKINQANGSGYFALAKDLNAGGTIYDDALVAKMGDYSEDGIDWETFSWMYSELSSATLAGLGHTIDKLTIHSSGKDNIGLIGKLNASSVVRDLGLTNVDIRAEAVPGPWGADGASGVGALFGGGQWNGLISQVYVSGSVSGRANVGGLGGNAGHMNSKSNSVVRHSFSEASVTATPWGQYDTGAGGLFAAGVNMHIYSSHTTGDVQGGNSMIGGLVGSMGGGSLSGFNDIGSTIQNSYTTGTVTGDESSGYIGGLVGRYNANSRHMVFSNNFATGDVTGGYRLGGLAGEFYNADTQGIYELETEPMLASNLYATGKVTSILPERSVGSSNGVGGLIGDLGGGVLLQGSWASGNVSATGQASSLGGLVGQTSMASFINNCLATGDVSAANGWGGPSGGLGGLVGSNLGTIENSTATGSVTAGDGYAGGLAGENRGVINNSFAYGNVEGAVVGGLVGANHWWTPTLGNRAPEISGSGAYGNVHSSHDMVWDNQTSAAGGLAGLNNGFISDSFATGIATGGVVNAGLVGNNTTFANHMPGETGHGSITNSYWNSEGNSVGANHDTNWEYGEPTMTGSQGLTQNQMNDVNHYIDGTIDQVLAQRAADEAARQAAIAREVAELTDTALKLGSGQELSVAKATQETPSVEDAGSFSVKPVALENFIVNNTIRSFSANIKTMEVDGVRYELEEESAN